MTAAAVVLGRSLTTKNTVRRNVVSISIYMPLEDRWLRHVQKWKTLGGQFLPSSDRTWRVDMSVCSHDGLS
ncbi:hypothetical protein ACOMHN_012873 [Nucella lapillus]